MSLRPLFLVFLWLGCGASAPDPRRVLNVRLERGPSALRVLASLTTGGCSDPGPYTATVNGIATSVTPEEYVEPPKPWFGPKPEPYCLPWGFAAAVPLEDLSDTLTLEVKGPGQWKGTAVISSPLIRQVALPPAVGADADAIDLRFAPGPAPTKFRAFTNSASEFGPFETPCVVRARPDPDVLRLRCARRQDGQPDGPSMFVSYDAVLPFTCENVTCASETLTFARSQVLAVQVTRAPLRPWSRVNSGTTDALLSVWGTSASDVWAVGGGWTSARGAFGTILHFDGAAWSAVPGAGSDALLGVWAAGPSDAWAVGPVGHVLHWNGTAWSSVAIEANARLQAVWGAAANDVWAVGYDGITLHWDAASWTRVPSMTRGSLASISGSGPKDIWVVGEANGATTQHWDGTSWKPGLPSISGADSFRTVFAASASEVWFANSLGLYHPTSPSQGCWAGRCAGDYHGLWGTGPGDLWAVGFDGPIRHFDGDFWTAFDAGETTQLRAVWGSGTDDVWAVGDRGSVFHFGR